jgi:phosphoserine aminotransferase
MKKMYNVASGPSVYPKVVLDRIAQGVLSIQGKEISTLELGHRSQLFVDILDELIARTKELLQVPEDFSILYVQGGARLHFAQIPMNFLAKHEKVQFIDTGYWSKNAAEYAKYYGEAEILISSEHSNYDHIPSIDVHGLDGKYVQYCANNTIYGTQFHQAIQANIPVVADMSSDIFTKEIDFENIGIVMACAQKNFGPAGMTVLIIKNDFLMQAREDIPAIFSYKNLANKNSNYNTPPIFQICAALEMLRWIKEKGGVSTLAKEVNERAATLYAAIDKSTLVRNNILAAHRSNTNIVFDAVSDTALEELKRRFAKANISGIKGHKARGGFRVGNYIAQEQQAIDAVLACL